LAAIIELNTALNMKVPEEYVSHLHIHQDGSCNGLQHYAALGRDLEGAYQVNLGPTEKPGDVYTHVSKMVSKMVEEDAGNPESPSNELAKKVTGHIKRKTIKQTVMTSVYGVTFMGAKNQILRQIKDQNFLQDEAEQIQTSKYLAKYTLDAISNLFSNAHHIKKWLLECAKLIAQEDSPVAWFTPMGLPVIQPYRVAYSESDSVTTAPQKLELTAESEHVPNANIATHKP
jgi:DNA-directed RNA polymerase